MQKSIHRYKLDFILTLLFTNVNTFFFCPSFPLFAIQVAIAALYYLSDIYLPSSLKEAESSENSESPDENWEYEWDEGEADDEFS
jgi:hypothetical protein